MRKFGYSIFLLTILLASNAWGLAFNVTDTYYEITGTLRTPAPHEILQSYILSSVNPLSYEIHDTLYPSTSGIYSYAKSIADEGYVYILAFDIGKQSAEASATAIATIDFVPNYDGYVQGITFAGQISVTNPRPHWTITDLTSNSLIVDTGFSTFQTTDPITYIGGTDYFRNSTHTYQLRMSVGAQADGAPEEPWISTRISSPSPNPPPSSCSASASPGWAAWRGGGTVAASGVHHRSTLRASGRSSAQDNVVPCSIDPLDAIVAPPWIAACPFTFQRPRSRSTPEHVRPRARRHPSWP